MINVLRETGRVTEIDATADEDSVFAAVEPVMDMIQDKGESVLWCWLPLIACSNGSFSSTIAMVVKLEKKGLVDCFASTSCGASQGFTHLGLRPCAQTNTQCEGNT